MVFAPADTALRRVGGGKTSAAATQQRAQEITTVTHRCASCGATQECSADGEKKSDPAARENDCAVKAAEAQVRPAEGCGAAPHQRGRAMWRTRRGRGDESGHGQAAAALQAAQDQEKHKETSAKDVDQPRRWNPTFSFGGTKDSDIIWYRGVAGQIPARHRLQQKAAQHARSDAPSITLYGPKARLCYCQQSPARAGHV